jgi:cell division cycle 20, cofactor of APC complex
LLPPFQYSSFRSACAPVNFENLLENSFNESSKSVKACVVPRWERKKLEKQAQSLSSGVFPKNSDRFIASRSGIDLSDTPSTGNYESSTGNDEFTAVAEGKRDVYASNLSTTLLGVEDLSNSRVLSYQDKAPAPTGDTVANLNILYSTTQAKQVQKKQNVKLVARQLPTRPTRVLDAPNLLDDYYLNLVSWSDTNWLAIVLGQTVYLWNAGSGDITELVSFDDDNLEQVTSVAWVQSGGVHLAIGTSSGKTQLWDVAQGKKLRAMDGHSDRVGALAWNRHMISSGSRDASIIHHDVRVANHIIAKLETHQQEVCSLAWNPTSDVLASGGNDDLLCLWDVAQTQPKYRFMEHRAAVKALAWSPHEPNLLASGAGTGDRTINLWNATTGALLNSVDTGSQVCSLVWNPFEKELLSSHGFPRNHLSLWKYPSMSKIKDFEAHDNRVLYTAVGPTGEVMSASTDETLAFWDIFTPLAQPKPRPGSGLELRTLQGKKKNWTMQIR